MNPQKEKEVVDLLNHYDTAGIPFAQAKKEIIAKGYTEAEIVYGLYSAPFDGKINEPRPANPLQAFYKENPEQADKVAKSLILAEEQKVADKVALNAAAAEFAPDIQTKSYYEVQTAELLGIPYFSLLFLGLIIFIICIKLHLSKQTTDTIFFIFILIINLVFVFKLVQQRWIVYRTRRDLRKKDKN